MAKITKFTSLLFVVFLLINIINAKNVANKEVEDSKDKYYLITVNNKYGDFKIYTKPKKSKRHLSKVEKFVFNFIDEIHELIVENKATFEDQEQLEEIESSGKLRKRSTKTEEIYANYGDSEFINPIASVDGYIIFNAYLSKPLAEEVATYDDVESVSPVRLVEPNHQNYNKEDILNETKWKNLSVKENADRHLSLISQGKYSPSHIAEYDDNYYFPSTAGEGVDIIIIDTSFNFTYFEFENTNEREIRCVADFERGQIITDPEYSCGYSYQKHGEQVADAAAGLNHGVATRANVLALALKVDRHFGMFSTNDIIAALGYASERMIKPHKTVINMSLSGPCNIEDDYYTGSEKLINEITDKGGIVVVSAGNASTKLHAEEKEEVYIPCQFESTICVGGIDSLNTTEISESYRKADHSNYGDNVDIYAPYNVQTEFVNNQREISSNQSPGTSFSSPMTAGIIATIISEYSNIKFTRDSMLQHLLKNAIPFEVDNEVCYMINNGKHIVYSANDEYRSCGIMAGNRPCQDLCGKDSSCKLQEKKDSCDLSSGIFEYDYNNKENYACLISYNDERNIYNPDNSACFISNDRKYCVKSEGTAFDECNPSGNSYDVKKCVNKVFSATHESGSNWDANLRDIKTMEKYTDIYELDRTECYKHGGVVLEKSSEEYVCVTRNFDSLSNSSGYCVNVILSHDQSEKITYCVDLLLTKMDICNKNTDKGNFEKCYDEISELSKGKVVHLEPYHYTESTN